MKALAVFFIAALSFNTSSAEIRNWTNLDGVVISGELVSFDGSTVTLRVNGTEYPYPLEKLCSQDQAYLDRYEKLQQSGGYDPDVPRGSQKKYRLTEKYTETVNGYFTTNAQRKARKYYEDYHIGDRRDPAKVGIEDQVGHSAESLSAEVYIPDNYSPEKPIGLYINVGAGSKAQLLPGWQNAFDDLYIIGASPRDASNKDPDMWRIARALDLVASLKAEYRINPDRIYVGGTSGGGLIGIYAVLLYPEVFKGSLCMVRHADFKNEVSYLSDSDIRQVARLDYRWAFVSGPKDFNYDYVNEKMEIWDDYGFDCRMFDIPGMQHRPAAPADFRKALQWIDEPNRQ